VATDVDGNLPRFMHWLHGGAKSGFVLVFACEPGRPLADTRLGNSL
jgi:hypothetical protein